MRGAKFTSQEASEAAEVGVVVVIRALIGLCIAISVSSAVAASDPQPESMSKSDLAVLVARHFPGAESVESRGLQFPSFRIADFDGDGRLDVVVPYTDRVTAKRGDGCYGLGFVSNYADQKSAKPVLQLYNCSKEYKIEVKEFIPLKIAGRERRIPVQPSRPCVRIVLKYDEIEFVCLDKSP
jgi:hypothetical protein